VILLVNDDGIDAPGFRALYRALRRATGKPVLAVAPATERSGMSHAISVDRPLRLTSRLEAGFFGFAVDGTPTDCTKLALDRLCTEPPDLVVSGINRGPNVGRSLFYSGTVGAAMEAAVLGLPALAVSRQVEATTVEDGAAFAATWASKLLGRREFAGTVVNLNLPGPASPSWREPLVMGHGYAGFRETYRQVRDAAQPADETRWRLHGEWQPGGPGDDAAALTAGHPVLSLLRPDFNAPDKALRKLAGTPTQTPERRRGR
jgi:5'-nucleotidase